MRLWGVCLLIAYRVARILFAITKPQIRGTMVAVWYQGKILLIRTPYRQYWSVPGGMLKKGETWPQAAVRETFEEVGLRLNEKDLVFMAEVPGELGPNDRSHFFEVNVDHPFDVTVDGWEVIKAEFVTPEDALERGLHDNVRKYLLKRMGSS